MGSAAGRASAPTGAGALAGAAAFLLAAAASQVGPRTLAAWLHSGLRVPFAKVATILRTGFGLTITPGGLVHALHRVAARGTPTYHTWAQVVWHSPVVSPDETGWKVGGRS